MITQNSAGHRDEYIEDIQSSFWYSSFSYFIYPNSFLVKNVYHRYTLLIVGGNFVKEEREKYHWKDVLQTPNFIYG